MHMRPTRWHNLFGASITQCATTAIARATLARLWLCQALVLAYVVYSGDPLSCIIGPVLEKVTSSPLAVSSSYLPDSRARVTIKGGCVVAGWATKEGNDVQRRSLLGHAHAARQCPWKLKRANKLPTWPWCRRYKNWLSCRRYTPKIFPAESFRVLTHTGPIHVHMANKPMDIRVDVNSSPAQGTLGMRAWASGLCLCFQQRMWPSVQHHKMCMLSTFALLDAAS